METDKIIVESFISKYPHKAAQVLDGLKEEEVAAFLQDLPVRLSLPLLHLMNSYKASKCFPLIPEVLVIRWLEGCDPTLAESLMRHFEEAYRNQILDKINPQLAILLRQKLEQNINSVGALMVPVPLAISKNLTVKDGLELIKKNQQEVLTDIYIVDESGNLQGILPIYTLLIAERSAPIGELLTEEASKFYADMPVSQLLDHPAWFKHRNIPVVDRNDKLIGSMPFERTRTELELPGQISKQILDTSSALGELYRIGLTGFLQSVGK